MNLFDEIRDHLTKVIIELVAEGRLPTGDLPYHAIAVEPPRDPGHGDMATNAAMVLAKPARSNPRQIADMIKPGLEKSPLVLSADIAGPGFINLKLTDQAWQAVLTSILKMGVHYGSSDLGQGQLVNVEYVSANPTGPLHVGHTRGAVFGDALANLLQKAGFAVTKEYYVNDAGGQIETLARSAYLRYSQACGQTIGPIPEGLYPGDYLIDVGHSLRALHGDALLSAQESDWLPIVKDHAVQEMMALIRDDLAAIGICHDVFFSEKTLHSSGRIQETIDHLRTRGHIYEGVLDPPKGQKPEDWEPREQTLFKATDFGDDVDRPLQKSDGSFTYFAADIAYHLDKYQRGFKSMINVWGADHGGYVKRVQSAIKALADDGELDVKLAQMVRLFRGGDVVRMSKRSGNFVTMRDVIDEVGKDAVRFIMLTRKNDAPLDFDFDAVLDQSKDNPVFYVQYAHARIFSVIRKAEEAFGADITTLETGAALDFSRHWSPALIDVISVMTGWPRAVNQAAEAHEPHRIAFYLYELASRFHTFWNKGNDDFSLRLFHEKDQDLTAVRVAMARAVALVIQSGLAILGVKPAEKM